MSEFDSSLLPEILAACRNGAGEIAEALGRVLDVKLTVAVGEPTPLVATLTNTAAGAALDGPGLAVVLAIGNTGGLALLAESSGLLPAWYAEPDVTGQSRLTTLAQEFGMLLVPDTVLISDFRAAHVEHLGQAITRAGAADDAVVVPLELTTSDERRTTLYYAVPCKSVVEALIAWEEIVEGAVTEVEIAPPKAPPQKQEKPAGVLRGEAAEAALAAEEQLQADRRLASLEDLPPYTKSLLRIRVPVMVTLAQKKQPISKILEIGPGTILQFQKSCDQLLELEVNGHAVGVGEAVKVGDKFGLRVTGMTLPGEKFKPLGKKQAG